MKIIVTGCAGFIGTNFVRYWLSEHPNDRVIGIDCLTYAANAEALSELRGREGFVFYKADICDVTAMDEIFAKEKPDAVVNFAAESHVDRSISDPSLFIRSNVVGTEVLLDASLKHGVKRFHQISTDEVYGDLPLDSGELFTEEWRLCPSSPYSASKASADLLVLSYYRTFGLSVTVSRASNNYGYFQHPEKLIPKVISLALAGKSIPIYGSGTNVRDWLYAMDHCRAVDLILSSGRAGEIYNVGGGTLLSNLELVKKILSLLDASPELISFVEDRKGHDRKYALSSEKLKRELLWSPATDFESGLCRTVEWYKNKS